MNGIEKEIKRVWTCTKSDNSYHSKRINENHARLGDSNVGIDRRTRQENESVISDTVTGISWRVGREGKQRIVTKGWEEGGRETAAQRTSWMFWWRRGSSDVIQPEWMASWLALNVAPAYCTHHHYSYLSITETRLRLLASRLIVFWKLRPERCVEIYANPANLSKQPYLYTCLSMQINILTDSEKFTRKKFVHTRRVSYLRIEFKTILITNRKVCCVSQTINNTV